MTKLSVVVALYNEEANVALMAEAIFSALNGYDYEVIMVNDGSTDKTAETVLAIDSKRITFVELMKNYGQSSAMAAGIEAAKGEFIATLDGDLQNDPSDIPAMLKLAEEGNWDMVAGIRANRKDGMLFRKIPSKIANKIIQSATGVRVKDYGCTLKVFRSSIAKNLELYGELHRFIPVLATLQGGRITQMDVKHHPRKHGKSNYGIDRTARVITDLLLMLFFQKYFKRPIHLFGALGLVTFTIGVIMELYMLVLNLLGEDNTGKSAIWLGVLLIIAGIQLIVFGIIAEMLMRTYYESQNKKPYAIRKVYIGKEQV